MNNIMSMFRSATLQLTAWYLLIIMVISLVFSAAIYQITTNEIETRLEQLQHGIEQAPRVIFPSDANLSRFRITQSAEAQTSLLTGLVYTNLLIFTLGGIGSYILARRTLRPIQRSHEAQSRFVSDASHELRTPLAAMKAELEVGLRDPIMSKHDMRELLVSNLEEVEKLTLLSQTLLQLSHLDADISYEELSLSETTQTVLRRANPAPNRVHFTSNNTAYVIMANSPQIEELITVLIDNALKYSPEDSVVDIKLDRSGRYAKLTVSNEGEGIDEADLPHIFDRFYRADSHRSTSGISKSGFGLGLSLAKEIVNRHEGLLSVSSGRKQLTTLTVCLPLYRLK